MKPSCRVGRGMSESLPIGCVRVAVCCSVLQCVAVCGRGCSVEYTRVVSHA